VTDRAAGRAPCALTGAGGGFFSGLTGVGGGAILVPLMTGVLRLRQHTAHGTSLVVIVFAALASAVVYQLDSGVRWGLVGALLPTSLIGAYLGAHWVQRLPALRLRQLFGAFVFLVGVRLLASGDVSAAFDLSGGADVAAGAAIGLAGGLVSGALGVGGGAIFVPALVLLLGVGQHDAQGVSICVIVGAAAVGAWTHARHGTVDLRAASWITPFAIPAGVLGALAASALNGDVLQRIFACVLVVVGVQMVVSSARALRRTRTAPAPEGAPA
jgi:uncharacterized membrane protein YfcA